MRFFRRHLHDDRGSNAAEVVLLVPTIVGLICFLVAGGRAAHADNSTLTAAMSAARAASLSRDATSATQNAEEAARRSMANAGITCSQLVVNVDASGLSAPIGVTGTVTVTVTCTVDLSDITLPGIPGARDMTSTASSPVDAFRARR